MLHCVVWLCTCTVLKHCIAYVFFCITVLCMDNSGGFFFSIVAECCFVLCYAHLVLYCVALYFICIVLYHTVLHCIYILSSIVHYSDVLYCTVHE